MGFELGLKQRLGLSEEEEKLLPLREKHVQKCWGGNGHFLFGRQERAQCGEGWGRELRCNAKRALITKPRILELWVWHTHL